jgi:hypothetical protein
MVDAACKLRMKLLQVCHEKERVSQAAFQVALGRRLDR